MLRHILRTRNFNAQHLQSLFYCTSSIPIKPSFSKYLVDSLGFTHHQSLSTSSKLAKWWHSDRVDGQKKVSDFRFAENADYVVNFFKQHGFTHTQIRNVVTKYPRILLANVEKTLIPKFWALQDLEFSGTHIADIISENAYLLARGMDSTILPAIRTLREVLGLSDDEVLSSLKKCRWHLDRDMKNMEMNVALLRSYGIPIEGILKMVLRNPATFCKNPESFKEVVIKVERLGIHRQSKMFVNAIRLLASNDWKAIESKIESFKSCGWAECEVMDLFRRLPDCFGLSELTIKKKLGFLITELGYGPADLVSHCCMLTYSLEKRVLPRHYVLLVLNQNDVNMKDYPLHRAVRLSESRFLAEFVVPFPEVHHLYAKDMGISMEKLTQQQ